MSPENRPRIDPVFALIGPLGTDLDHVVNVLSEELEYFGCEPQSYRLSNLMRDLPSPPWNRLRPNLPLDEHISSHMDAATKLCEKLGRGDAMAMLGILAMRVNRGAGRGRTVRPAPILHSVKRPQEIQTLRRIYGPGVIVVGAYAPRDRRLEDLAKRIAHSRHSNRSDEFLGAAEKLLRKDEDEQLRVGQATRKAFAESDIVINIDDSKTARIAIARALDLLFGNPFITPTTDEEGMKFAQIASFRSAALARQVGAVICRPDGTIVSAGMNEVPKAGGGQYLSTDCSDGRDFIVGRDTSDLMRQNVLADFLDRLQKAQWLTKQKGAKPIPVLVMEAMSFMKTAQFMDTIDYVRAVHAEMAAITNASRHGQSIQGCTLYTTTFPCHDCAKHIVASGITRVVYAEPYPKSLVRELFGDSVQVDPSHANGSKVRFEPFVGVAPRRYGELFELGRRQRKDEDGRVKRWKRRVDLPLAFETLVSGVSQHLSETAELKGFLDQLKGLDRRRKK